MFSPGLLNVFGKTFRSLCFPLGEGLAGDSVLPCYNFAKQSSTLLESFMSFNSKLTDLLKTDQRLVDDEGELLIAAVQDRAWKIDHDLVRLLLSDKEIKAKFFEEIEGHWIFNINIFLEYISQKNFLDNSYTRFRNRLGLMIGDKYLRERGDVSLVWAYKDTVLEGGQTKEEEKRKEIFFNEVLAQDEINRLLDPKVLTNFTRYTAKGKEAVKEFKRDENGAIRENLILKGNNLLALHTLKTQFRGQVKLIYIDPPYNTGTDSFGYNDNFNHSTWLTFMKNRLEIARQLLSDDGFIFISCDDNEQAYLKILCDEIFQSDNFVSQIIVQSNKRGQTYQEIAKTHEYLLVYAKSDLSEIKELEKSNGFSITDDKGGYELRELRNRNPKFGRFNRPNLFYPIYVDPTNKDKDGLLPVSLEKSSKYSVRVLPLNSAGGESCWRWGKDKVRANSSENTRTDDLVAKMKTTSEFGVYEKYRKVTYKAKSLWLESEVISEQGTMELRQLGLSDEFNFPKPSYLIKKILQIGSNEDSIVLDFCAGSGTTAQAVLELNRQDTGKRSFILVEQLDYVEKVTVERARKALEKENDFIYCELMKYNEAFIERIQSAKTSKELLKIWQEMSKDSFLNWYVNPKMPEEAVKDFEAIGKEENGFEKQKLLLVELLDKNQLYVNLSEIDDADFKVGKEDKALNKAFYGEA
jgi:adenine-specific DNA-methyltransferase